MHTTYGKNSKKCVQEFKSNSKSEFEDRFQDFEDEVIFSFI